jgi:hypothetical protein
MTDLVISAAPNLYPDAYEGCPGHLRRRATINESRGIRFTLVEAAHERAQMER